MSLIPIKGVLETVAKAESVDAESTSLLCQMTLFDVLGELCDLARPSFEADVEAFVAKRAEDTRRALVKHYLERRLAGEDVEDVLKAANHAALLEANVSKASKDDPNTPWYDARDMAGRFTSGANTGTKALQTSGRTGYVDPVRNERYKALREVGTGLATMSGVPGASTVGAMATAAGGLGPEAERVLGRGMKRTAYRYRGTERTADKTVTAQVSNGGKIIEALTTKPELMDELSAALGKSPVRGQTFDPSVRRVQPGQEPFMAVARHWRSEGAKRRFTEDQLKLAVQGDVAVEYLRHKLPTPRQTAISMAAGRTPPSVGLMIDRDGDVVSEAQGFNGDHFLPFDLKNLKRLHGGQYVRTRAMGGPTVEDIYTGLLTGARQMQVVSNSGVFTIEFDPTIRGGRRYSDKATQMIRRYEALLGTIDSGQLMQQDVDPDKKRELREAAISEARGNTGRAKEIYQDLLEEERGRQSFAFQEDDELEAQAVAEAREELGGNAGRAQIADLAQEKFRFLRQQQKASRVKSFQLDADGYAAAMRSLKEEFPFYIRDVRVETIPEFVRSRGTGDPESADVPVHNNAADRGHIEHGETNIRAQSKYGEEQGLGRGLKSDDPRVGARAARTETTEGEGEESTTTAGAGPRTAIQRKEDLPNMGSWAVKPATLEKKTKKLSEMANLKDPAVQTEAKKGFNKAAQAILDHMLASNEEIANGSETDIDVVLDHTASADVVRWFANHGGFAKIASLEGEQRSKALAHLEKLGSDVQGQSKIKGEDAEAKKAVMEAAKGVAAIAAAAEPFAGPFELGKVLESEYDPSDNKPRFFAEINELGDKPENYGHYKAAARRSDLLEVRDYLDMDENQVKAEIGNLRSWINQVRNDDLDHPNPVVRRDLEKEAEDPGKGPLSRKMQAAHLAWAYHRGLALAQAAPKPAQTAAPSAPAGGGGGTSTPFPVGFTRTKKRHEVRYSPEQIRKAFAGGPLESVVSKALTDLTSGR